ncbi:formin-like protein 5 [Iris pallida]|uniref:Formin-like protein 5 n=1 Tax=Iris pallida TaxID=29817 RepID=A0AAX6GTS1_IRIPA|nr:formin-like protein 5 [Iris pallida]
MQPTSPSSPTPCPTKTPFHLLLGWPSPGPAWPSTTMVFSFSSITSSSSPPFETPTTIISNHHHHSTHCTVNHQFRHHLLQWSPTVVEAARPRALADGARPRSPSACSRSRSNKRLQQCATCARARTALPRRRRPPTGVADPSVGAPPGRTLSCLPWRPTSSGTRRRGDSCVLHDVPS